MAEFGQVLSDAGVRFERAMPAGVEQVWAYLTDSDLLPEWLGNGEISAEVGGRVELRSGGPVIRGAVLAREPQQLLSYSWLPLIPGEDTAMADESVVTFALETRGDGTMLVLTQSPIAPEYRSRTAAGWHALLDILSSRLAGEPPPDFVDTFHRVLPEYEKTAG